MSNTSQNSEQKNQKKPEEIPSVWDILEERKKRGLWHGEIDTYKVNEYNLNIKKGKHYFIVDDPRARSIKCTSCPMTHGGILEAHLLARYRVEDGVIYFDDKPLNETQ